MKKYDESIRLVLVVFKLIVIFVNFSISFDLMSIKLFFRSLFGFLRKTCGSYY